VKEIKEIQERNRRVEADKAWEISTTRKLNLAAITYVVVVITLILIDAPRPYLNALIPTIGFLLSTLTLKFVKMWWLKNVYMR